MKNFLIIFVFILFETCLFGQTGIDVFVGKTFIIEEGEDNIRNFLKHDTVILLQDKEFEFLKSNIIFNLDSTLKVSYNVHVDSVVTHSVIDINKDTLVRVLLVSLVEGKWQYNDIDRKLILKLIDYEKVEAYDVCIYNVIIKPDKIELIRIK